MSRLWWVSVAASLLGAGCSDGPGKDPVSSSDELIGGTETLWHPEVGAVRFRRRTLAPNHFTFCTGTLVSPRVVITAAHCIDYGKSTAPGDYGAFVIQRLFEAPRPFVVTEYVSIGNNANYREDLALLRLATPVPADIATPAHIAQVYPGVGSAVSVLGMGCTDRANTSSGTGAKRQIDTTWAGENGPPTNAACPGDSGGPILTPDGAVVGVFHGYFLGAAGGDVYAWVPPKYEGFGNLAFVVYVWTVG